MKVDKIMALFFEDSKEEPIKVFTIIRWGFVCILLLYLIIGLQDTDLLLSRSIYLILALMFLLDMVESWLQKSKYMLRYSLLSLVFLLLFFSY